MRVLRAFSAKMVMLGKNIDCLGWKSGRNNMFRRFHESRSRTVSTDYLKFCSIVFCLYKMCFIINQIWER